MPEPRAETIQSSETPYQGFIAGMKRYLENGGARMTMLLGLEKRGESLSGREGVSFLGGVCQMVDDLIINEFLNKGVDFPGAEAAIKQLTGKKVDQKVLQATEELFKPWMEEFEVLKPEIGEQIQIGSEAIDQYPLEHISADKITFALNLLINHESSQVRVLPGRIKKKGKEWAEVLKEAKKGFKDEQKWRELGWKGVVVSATNIVLAVALAAGSIFGVSVAVSSPEVREFFSNLPQLAERAPGAIGDAATEKARNNRYEKYQNKYKTIIENKNWPERVKAENILTYLDPSAGYNEWKAIVEFCGPQCFVDPAWAPGEGRQVMMDFFGVDEAGLQDLYHHPEEIPDQLQAIYPDKPWLWELFSITPTPLNGEGESDFEKWQEKYKTSLGPTLLCDLGRVSIVNDIHTFRRNQFIGQRAGFMNRGRGFGTPKGV
jgi:hypothetical protein